MLDLSVLCPPQYWTGRTACLCSTAKISKYRLKATAGNCAGVSHCRLGGCPEWTTDRRQRRTASSRLLQPGDLIFDLDFLHRSTNKCFRQGWKVISEHCRES